MTKQEALAKTFEALGKLTSEEFKAKMDSVELAYDAIPSYISEPTPVFVRKASGSEGLEATEYQQSLSAAYVPQEAYELIKEELALVIKIGVEGQRNLNDRQYKQYLSDLALKDLEITRLKDALSFYANTNNYNTNGTVFSIVDLGEGYKEQIQDFGMVAEKALKAGG